MTQTTEGAPDGPWDAGTLAQLQKFDEPWGRTCRTMSTNPWSGNILSRKFGELVAVAVNVACTNLNRDGTLRHIRAALDAGATPDEILAVVKMGSVMSIHSCSLGAPILLEEAVAAGKSPVAKAPVATPACDRMKAIGQWNTAWDPFFALDPQCVDFH